MSITTERLQSQILRELSILLQREIKNTKIGYVTITEVRLTNDLSCAYVYYTVLGNKDRIEVTQEALEQSEGFIKNEIAKKVKKLNLSVVGTKRDLFPKNIKDESLIAFFM